MDGFLGPSPDPIVGPELLSWELYWRFLRPGTSPDHPVDPDGALRLYDRIHGQPDDAVRVLEDLAALDGEYAAWRGRKLEGQREEIGRGGPRPPRARPKPKPLPRLG